MSRRKEPYANSVHDDGEGDVAKGSRLAVQYTLSVAIDVSDGSAVSLGLLLGPETTVALFDAWLFEDDTDGYSRRPPRSTVNPSVS